MVSQILRRHGIFYLPGIFHNKRLVDMLSMQSSNFDRKIFHFFEIETTNNFNNLNFSGSENVVNPPNSDLAPTQHSSPIPPPFRPKNLQRNWSTLLINCRRFKERGGGPRVVGSTAAFNARVRG